MDEIERRIAEIDSWTALAGYALGCGERVAGLLKLMPQDVPTQMIQGCLDRAWKSVKDGRVSTGDIVGSSGAEAVLGLLVESDFGRFHVALFDAVTVIGHAVWCAARSDDLDAARAEARWTRSGTFRLLEGVFHEQHGQFGGWRDHESTLLEVSRQMQDLDLLVDDPSPSAVEAVRRRAVKDSFSVMAGVTEQDWSLRFPAGEQTLF